MKGFGITDVGKRRPDNQDNFRLELTESGEGSIFVVCDGMGGARAGGLASELAAEAFLESVKALIEEDGDCSPEELVGAAVRIANSRVSVRAAADPDCRGMGTTLVGGVYKSGRVALANVGDSRAYLLQDGRIEQVTTDHSLVEAMVSRGEITREQAWSHPRKNVVTRVLGMEPSVSADIFTPEYKPGARLLLCSDGLSNVVRDEEILNLALTFPESEPLCGELLKLTLQRGAPDNVAVVAVEL